MNYQTLSDQYPYNIAWHNMVMSPIRLEALSFATERHGEQRRKYTDELYINHPIRVAYLVNNYDSYHTETSDTNVCAALLHDVLEDTDTTLRELVDNFGHPIANMVFALSKPAYLPGYSRAHGKSWERKRLMGCTSDVQTIKMADMIDNTHDIDKFDDPGKARQYMVEQRELFKALTKADTGLRSRMHIQLREYFDGNPS